MGSLASGNNIVDQMGVLNISGNVIPQIWYKTITKTTGKPYLLAITLLADIVYWYRPREVRDEASGQIVGWHKKFKGDLLQKTYQQYADLLGESKRSVKAALDRLEELGVIRKEFRDIEYENGLTMYNLMYIALNVDVLTKLTYPEKTGESAELQDFVPPPTKNCTTPSQKLEEGGTKNCRGIYRNPEEGIQEIAGGYTKNSNTPIQKNVSPHTEIRGTNTYITTENTHRDISSINQSDGNEKRAEIYKADNDMIDVMDDASAYMKIIRENIEYGYHMKYDSVQDRELYEELYGVICDVVCVRRKSVKVNGEDYPYELVKSKFLKLDSGHLEYVINSMKAADKKEEKPSDGAGDPGNNAGGGSDGKENEPDVNINISVIDTAATRPENGRHHANPGTAEDSELDTTGKDQDLTELSDDGYAIRKTGKPVKTGDEDYAKLLVTAAIGLACVVLLILLCGITEAGSYIAFFIGRIFFRKNRKGFHGILTKTENPYLTVDAPENMTETVQDVIDRTGSTEENPRQSMEQEQKLKAGEIVPVDILIWPMGLKFKKGDILRITVSPYKTKKMWMGPFKLKMAKINLPKEGYTYFPEDKPEMYTIGGSEMFADSEVDTSDMPKDHNKGRHRIYTGGKYDSFLYVPIIPEKVE